MENEGTVTISLERFKELEACEKVALSGALGIDAYDIIGSYRIKYYSTEKAITKLIDENNRMEDVIDDIFKRNSILNNQKRNLEDELKELKSMTVKEFKQYKRNEIII